MPKSEPRAARRSELQEDPQLLDEILRGPIATAIAYLQFASDTEGGRRAKGLAMISLKKALARTGSLHARPTHIARSLIRALKAAGAHNQPVPLPNAKDPGDLLDELMEDLISIIQKFPSTPWHLPKGDYIRALDIINATIQTATDFWLIPTEAQVAQLRPIIPKIKAYITPMGTA